MQPTHMIWGTIIGYILFALAISMITSLWIRHHLKRKVVNQHCLMSDRPIIYPHCLLKDRPNKKH
ncbi:hypothetical protein [Psychrobacter sp.]|uniref:hypothetical protein n=1 Tax=Psychrobacter sp. TaxID=56811 RepID=UPI0025F11905|nr:hypothetical protein [Psychrobacter sp.]